MNALLAKSLVFVATLACSFAVPNAARCDDIASLIKDLGSPNVVTRAAAARRLSELGPEASPAIPVLVKSLDDDDRDVRDWACWAFAHIGDKSIPALLDVLGTPRRAARARVAAIMSLGNMKVAFAKVDDALIKELREKERDFRFYAVAALANRNVTSATPALVALIEHEEDFGVRRDAIRAIMHFGPAGKAAVPALVRIVKKEWFMAAEAGPALVYVGGEGIAALMALAKDKKNPADVRARAIRALTMTHLPLADVPDAPETALPALLVLLNEEEAEVQWAAIHALGRFGPKATRAVPALRKFLDSNDPQLRRAAADALENIGPLLAK